MPGTTSLTVTPQIWNPRTFEKQASFTSHYDVGDVFCVSYSTRLHTVYFGSQNTSIQWFDLRERKRPLMDAPNRLPYLREDKFFDSAGPGGVYDATQSRQNDRPANGNDHLLEVPQGNVYHFAHFGYVNCMLLCRGALVSLQAMEALISGGGDGCVHVWTVDEHAGGHLRHSNTLGEGHEDVESILTMALDGTTLFTGRVRGEINAWDLETSQLLRAFRSDNADILSLAITRDSWISLNGSGIARVSTMGSDADVTLTSSHF